MANETANGAPRNRPARSDFEIVTEPGNGIGPKDWTVRAIWREARRIVFTGSAFERCAWVREQLEGAG